MDTNWSAVIKGMERRGWTLAAISRETGMAPGTVGDIKRGRTKAPTGDSAVRLHQLHTSKAKPAPAAPKVASRP